jgi:hypothetical protein
LIVHSSRIHMGRRSQFDRHGLIQHLRSRWAPPPQRGD